MSQITNAQLAEVYAFKKLQLEKSNPKKQPVELEPDDLNEWLKAFGAKPA